jgi:hypothetical protein
MSWNIKKMRNATTNVMIILINKYGSFPAINKSLGTGIHLFTLFKSISKMDAAYPIMGAKIKSANPIPRQIG